MKLKQPSVLQLFAALVFIHLGAIPAARGALTDGLISYWPFETVDNGATPDLIRENDFTLVGTPTGTAGQKGSAFQFDGTSSYLLNTHGTDPAVSGLPIYRLGGYTVAMWVKGAAQANRYVFAEGSTTSNNPLFIIQTGSGANNNKVDIIIRNAAGGAAGTPVNHLVSSTVVFDDTWHHVAWVDTDGSVQLYIDGVLDATSFNYTPVGSIPFTTTAVGTLVRAAVATGNIFNGAVDDVAVWGRALSEAEVNELRTTGISVSGGTLPPTLEGDLQDATRRVGDWHIFTVPLGGTRPFSFQWSKGGIPIADATNETLRIFNLTTDNHGEVYSLSVSNSAGGVTTRSATLTVLADEAPAVSSGLINYWPLDTINQEDSTLVSPDLYSGNDMVLVNFLDVNDTVPGQYSNALSFDFVSKYAYRTNGSPIYNFTNYSVALWVKAPFETQNDRRIFSEGSTQSNNPLFTIGTDPTGNSPSAAIFIRNDAGANAAIAGRISARPVFDDTWHHVVWTDAGGEARLYIDGVLDESDYRYTRSSLTLDTTSLGAVLRAVPGNFFFGALDEVATWKRVLSWTEIQQIRTNGIPAPAGAVAPAITVQPTSRTNGIFQGDTITWTVQASGTVPLSFQWYKDSEPISVQQNSSAGTDTLILSNVQPSAAGEYLVVVTNAAGSASSSVATLANITPYTPKTSGEVLKIDVGLSTSPNVQAGFDEFNLRMNGTNFNGVGVTISPIGGATLADRNRTTGARVTNSAPDLTLAQLYNDFAFGNSTTDGGGLRIRLTRLAPNTPHALTLWSYDPQSTGDRISDWTEVSSGTAIPIQLGYIFNGSLQPTNDSDYTMSALLTSSPAGELVLEGVKSGGTGLAAFLNGIRLVASPSTAAPRITATELLNGKVRITVEAASDGQTISLQQTSDLGTQNWVPAENVTTLQSAGGTTIYEVPATAPHLFYRVVAAQP